LIKEKLGGKLTTRNCSTNSKSWSKPIAPFTLPPQSRSTPGSPDVPCDFFTAGNGKERFGHISVTDIKDLKKKTEAAVSSNVADKLQHAQLEME
jgi:hypothetical protein